MHEPTAARAAAPPDGPLSGVSRGGVPVAIHIVLPTPTHQLLTWQRNRLISWLSRLDPDLWAHSSRCEQWDIRDVVAHLIDTNRWTLGALAVAADPALGPQLRVFDRFDPRETPHEQVLTARGQTPAELLAQLRETSDVAGRALARAAADPQFPAVAWVNGPRYQPALVAMHLLWDSWLHERDICVALGQDVGYDLDDELTALAAYAVLLTGVVMTRFRDRFPPSGFHVELTPHQFDLTFAGTTPPVAMTVTRCSEVGAGHVLPSLRGELIGTVEALSGRSPLHEVVAADDETLACFGVLAAVLGRLG
jgi:uncharacterized protein (TIGR03083 family)